MLRNLWVIVSAFRTRASVESKHFKWLKGEEHLSKYHFSEYNIKTFCAICGSNLISISEDHPDYIGLPIGALEQDPSNRPLMNLFVDSKAPWYDITDGLPQYDAWPPGGPDSVRASNKNTIEE